MLRKLLIVLLLMCCSFCFAANIPVEKRAKYKAEIEAYTVKQLPIIKKNIDKEYDRGIEIYKSCLADRNKSDNLEPYITYIEGAAGEIDAQEFYFYVGLINITDKYVKIKKDIPITDMTADIANFVYPYLAKNNINFRDVEEISNYTDLKMEMLNKYINVLYKIRN